MEVIEIIFAQPVTADFIAGKLYRFLVRDDLSPELRASSARSCVTHDYELKPLLTAIFSSQDFYSPASLGSHIKGPVEHLVSMMKPSAPRDPGHSRPQ